MSAKKRKASLSSTSAVQEMLRKCITDFNGTSTLVGHDSQKKNLEELLKRTVTVGESNSLIIIGPRGCGKTLLLTSVLNDMRSLDLHGNILEVHLNGLLQTDIGIAIKEITRQLHLENTVGDRVFGSVAENLAFLLETLKSGGKCTKTIIFILNEFDQFCSHHNQTLLYNLFDITQSEQTPIAVIGLTCRLDVLELLEKRVKSRFSHRRIHMFSDFTFEEYLQLFMSILTIDNDEINNNYVVAWNKHVKELIENVSVKNTVKRIFNQTKDVQTLKSFLFTLVCKLDSSKQFLEQGDFEEAYERFAQNSKSLMLHGMSVLELCLILAMHKLTQIYDGEPFNFEMVYKEYLKLASRRSSILFEKEIVMKTFDHLINLELVCVVERTMESVEKRFRLVTLSLDSSQVAQALQSKTLPTDVRQWASSLIS